jgi:hypothetical protein
MQKIIVLAVFLALAFAQSPQNGQLNPTTITSGQYISGALQPTTTAANYHVDLYQFWIPENTSAVNLTFINQNPTDCYYLSLYVRGQNSGGLPCSNQDYVDSQYPCAMDWSIYDGIPGTYTQFLESDESDNLYEWEVNSWLYISVGRYDLDNTAACTYSFSATINGSCQTGSIGYGSSDQTQCAPYQTVTNGQGVNITSDGVNTFQAVYKMAVPLDVGHVLVSINSSDSSFYLTAKSFGAPYGSNYNCYESSYEYYNSTTGLYYYNLYCYTPRAGAFYMFLTEDYAFNATVSFSYLVCPTGMGGFNCTTTSVELNQTNAQTFNVPSTSSLSSAGFAYVYVDIPANYTGSDVTVVAYQTGTQSGSSYLYMRYLGYPEDSSTYGYTTSYQYQSLPATFSLNNFDFVMGGRWYFGLECYSGSNGCNITVAQNSSNSVVTTAAVQTTTATASGITSGTTTKGITSGTTTAGVGSTTHSMTTSPLTTRSITSGRFTTGVATTAGATTSQPQKSSAVVIVPSFIAAIFAILAMF